MNVGIQPSLEALGISSIWQPPLGGSKLELLLFFMHGRGDSADGWADFQAELGLPGLGVLLPNAPDRYYTGYSWYGLAPDQLPGITRSRALLERAIPELQRQGLAPGKLVLGGFSQGCLMTLEFGARFKERLAGYLGISGFCYDPARLLAEASPAAREGSWLVTHGTEDGVLPVETTRAQIAELKSGGLPIEYREYRKDHTLDPTSELPQIRDWVRKRLEEASAG